MDRADSVNKPFVVGGGGVAVDVATLHADRTELARENGTRKVLSTMFDRLYVSYMCKIVQILQYLQGDRNYKGATGRYRMIYKRPRRTAAALKNEEKNEIFFKNHDTVVRY
jgi:hypothetical protein